MAIVNVMIRINIGHPPGRTPYIAGRTPARTTLPPRIVYGRGFFSTSQLELVLHARASLVLQQKGRRTWMTMAGKDMLR